MMQSDFVNWRQVGGERTSDYGTLLRSKGGFVGAIGSYGYVSMSDDGGRRWIMPPDVKGIGRLDEHLTAMVEGAVGEVRTKLERFGREDQTRGSYDTKLDL